LSSQLRQKFLTPQLRIVTVIKLTQQEENQSMYLINPKNQNKLGSRRSHDKEEFCFPFLCFPQKNSEAFGVRRSRRKKASIRFAVREQIRFWRWVLGLGFSLLWHKIDGSEREDHP
jgi:hypothetical protein